VSSRAAKRTTPSPPPAPLVAWEPRHPRAAALAAFSVWILMLSIPMFTGSFLATPFNDQYSSGYAYRAWAAEWWKKLGHVPLWNPDIFGGMPFLAGMSGDVLYPTAWLRLVLPTHVAMNLGFAIHYVLAAVFIYWFLRLWRVSWAGAVVGGLAYQLSGVIGSYVSPGHDGKLFVTTMLPLLLVGLTLGIRDRRFEGYGIAALAVGLIMLSPHPQMAEYALLAAGIFTLFLAFDRETVTTTRARVTALGLALLAVALGVGISAAQYLPFYEYIPYSPRDATVLNDFRWSAAYAIPWRHLPELLIPRFTGESFSGTYWGPNGVKLHSEYLGLTAVALGVVGAMDRSRRRMVLWLAGIAALFFLLALGAATPVFILWWKFVPFAKSTRAPGMALYIVSFVVATFAAFGTDRILSGAASRFATIALAAGGAVALLGAAGLFGALAVALGRGVEAARGFPNPPSLYETAGQTMQWSSLFAGVALALAGLAAMLLRRRRLSPKAVALILVVIIGNDLWVNAQAFWNYSEAPRDLFAADAIKTRLRGVRPPLRVWDVDLPGRRVQSVYPGAALMADDIPQMYGHHANEPHSFDALNGRVGSSLVFRAAGDQRILSLFGVNYLIISAAASPETIPGYRRTLANVPTSSGTPASLFERKEPVPYARLVPMAIASTLDQSVVTMLSQAFPADRVVLTDSAMAKSDTTKAKAITLPAALPAALPNVVEVHDWVPGRMRLSVTQPAAAPAYVVVSENWDRPWHAWVDGRETRVLRGDATLITVPVGAGAREIELRYESAAFERGKVISILCLLIALAGIAGPVVWRRRRGSTTAMHTG
jgi:hypothetical protein